MPCILSVLLNCCIIGPACLGLAASTVMRACAIFVHAGRPFTAHLLPPISGNAHLLPRGFASPTGGSVDACLHGTMQVTGGGVGRLCNAGRVPHLSRTSPSHFTWRIKNKCLSRPVAAPAAASLSPHTTSVRRSSRSQLGAQLLVPILRAVVTLGVSHEGGTVGDCELCGFVRVALSWAWNRFGEDTARSPWPQ